MRDFTHSIQPQSAVQIALEYLPFCHPSVGTDWTDGCHDPADHSQRFIGGDGTPSFHLFDRIAATIGGRRRRHVNALAQWRTAIGVTPGICHVRGIGLDHHVVLFIRIGTMDDVHFGHGQLSVQVGLLNRLLLDTLRRSDLTNFAAAYFDWSPSPVDVANQVRAVVPNHSGPDPTCRALGAFGFSQRFVEVRQQQGRVGLAHIRCRRSCLFNLAGPQAKMAIQVWSPRVVNGVSDSVGLGILPRFSRLHELSSAVRRESKHVLSGLYRLGRRMGCLSNDFFGRRQPAFDVQGFDGFDHDFPAA